MKFFKYTILALAAVGLATGFTACSDDDDYTPGAAVSGVFFEAGAPLAYEVPKSATTFEVEIGRSGATEAATYNIVATTDAPAGALTFPGSVTFAAGQSVAQYVVTYNSALLADTYNVSLAFAEGTAISPYGDASYEFTVKAAPAYGAWTKFLTGTGTYSYISLPQQFGLPATDPGLDIYCRTNADDPNDVQLKITHWGFNTDFDFNLNKATSIITVPLQPWMEADEEGNLEQIQVNVTNLGVCDMFIIDLESYAAAYQPEILEQFKNTSYFDEEEGLIVLGVAYLAKYEGNYYVLDGAYGQEFFQLDGFATAAVEFEYNGVFTDKMNKQYANFTVSVGEAATKCVIAASKTLKGDNLVAAIAYGGLEGVEVQPGENQEILVPIDGAGSYDAAIVSWRGEEPNSYAVTSFKVKGMEGDVEDADWKSHGVGELVDGWITARYIFTGNDGNKYTFEDLPWEVMVDQNVTTPTLYRMVNPWSDPNSLVVIQGINTNPEEANILIDCANPNFVKIDPQYSGCSMTMQQGAKPSKIDIGNYSFLLGEELKDGTIVDEEFIISKGLNSTLEDDVVLVPKGACCFGYDGEFGSAWVDADKNPIGYAEIYLGDPDTSLGARQRAHKRAADRLAVTRAFNPAGSMFSIMPQGRNARIQANPALNFVVKK